MDRLANLSFSVTDDEELEKQAEMFQQVCSRRLQFIDGEDNDEEVWADTNSVPSRLVKLTCPQVNLKMAYNSRLTFISGIFPK